MLSLCGLAVLFLAASPSARASVSVSDGNFVNWIFGNLGTTTATLESSGGNPGACFGITTDSGQQTFGWGIKADYSDSEPLQGAQLRLTIDIMAGPGDHDMGQAEMLMVQQGSDVYGLTLGSSYVPNGWQTYVLPVTMDAANFEHLAGSGASTPNLGGGVSTEFGYGAWNYNSNLNGQTLTQYYDNFSLVSLPEPSSLALLGLACLSLLRHRAR